MLDDRLNHRQNVHTNIFKVCTLSEKNNITKVCALFPTNDVTFSPLGCDKQCLTPEELENAKIGLIRTCQEAYFGRDMQKLKGKGLLPKDIRLKPLYPFIDQHGLLRIRGRLQHSEFSYNKKHPIIIPYGSDLMRTIIGDAHKHMRSIPLQSNESKRCCHEQGVCRHFHMYDNKSRSQ